MTATTYAPTPLPSASKSSAIKAGWICLGLGALTFWIFGIGFVFFSVGIILGIVGMATNQVNQGIILFISSFASLILCAIVFFVLIVGTVGLGVSKIADDAKRQAKTRQSAFR